MKKIYLTIIVFLGVFQFTYAQWTANGNNAYFNLSGNVGIGTSNPTGVLTIGGNRTAPFWGQSGINIQVDPANYLDNSSSGQQGVPLAFNSFGTPTISTSSSGVSYSTLANVYIAGAPVSGANSPVLNNPLSLWVASGNTQFGNKSISGGSGIYQFNSTLSTAGTLLFSELVTTSTGSSIGYSNLLILNGTSSTIANTFAGVANSYNTGATQRLAVYDSYITNFGAGTVATAANLYIHSLGNAGGGSVTNNYGVFVESQTAGTNNYAIYTDGATQSYFGGKVGIGTTSPTHTLTLGSVSNGVAAYNTADQVTNYERAVQYWTANTYTFTTQAGGTGVVRNFAFTGSGNVLIGKSSQTNSSYKLDINGNVRANEIVVNTSGADFVFDHSYHLPSLSSLEKYISQNHHLPEIAPAKQMQADGLNVGDNQVKLLQKVEELTLYLIEEDKQEKQQEARINKLEKEIKLLKKGIKLNSSLETK